ncbi:MAG: hypothetical protein KAU35_06110 [candidate division Zixibacteria bacterium]|nr:hypothetical protein [candidate division Zixibacteria bacterium]
MDSSSLRDRLEISRQTRAGLAASAEQPRNGESSVTNDSRLEKVTYDKRDIKKTTGEASASGLIDARPDDSGENAKIDRVRRRIQTGFYDQPQVKREIARKLLGEIARPTDGQSRS